MSAVVRLRRVAKRLAVAQGGVAAIEFAFVLPVLLILLFGTFEVSKYIQTNNQVVRTVSMVGQMASQLPANAGSADVQRLWSAAPLIAPEALRIAERRGAADWSDVLSVTITSINFTKRVASCQTNCVYDGDVAWSVGQSPISCGKIPSGTALKPTSAVIPDELYAEGSVLFVRATLPYAPYLTGTAGFLEGLAGALTTTLSEQSWFLPRNAARIVMSGTGAPTPKVQLCPGVNS